MYVPRKIEKSKTPFSKPIKILQHLIEVASNKNDVVFDPFMGVASTGIAALKSGRKFYGCEINYEYYKASVERIKEFYINN